MGSSFLESLEVPKYLNIFRNAHPPSAIAKNHDSHQRLTLANDNVARL